MKSGISLSEKMSYQSARRQDRVKGIYLDELRWGNSWLDDAEIKRAFISHAWNKISKLKWDEPQRIN